MSTVAAAAQHKIEFLQSLATAYLIFQLICMAPPLPITRRRRGHQQLLFNAYALATISAVLYVAYIFIIDFQTVYLVADFTNRSVDLMLIFAHLIVCIEGALTKVDHQRLLHALYEFDCTAYEFRQQPEVVKWRQMYGLFAVNLSFFILGCVLHYGQGRSWLFYRILFAVGVAKVAAYTRIMQVSFYVDMLNERLQLINDVLRQPMPPQTTLEKVQAMHGKLWEVTQAINGSVGWSLIAIILENIMDLVNCWHTIYFNVTCHWTNLSSFIGIWCNYYI